MKTLAGEVTQLQPRKRNDPSYFLSVCVSLSIKGNSLSHQNMVVIVVLVWFRSPNKNPSSLSSMRFFSKPERETEMGNVCSSCFFFSEFEIFYDSIFLVGFGSKLGIYACDACPCCLFVFEPGDWFVTSLSGQSVTMSVIIPYTECYLFLFLF